jgi:opacity protein-like surface antigen
MTQTNLCVFTTCLVMCFSIAKAQNDSITEKANKYVYNSLMDSNFKQGKSASKVETKASSETDVNYSGNWMLGAGINMIEDSGHQSFGDFFSFKHKNSGNPFMVHVEYLINSQFSVSTTLLLNKHQSGKDVQGLTIQSASEPSYFATDVAVTYYVLDISSKHKFTPYATAGTGYRHISNYSAANQANVLVEIPKTRDITLNAGLGVAYWFHKNWALNMSYIAKFSLKAGANKNNKTNHLVSSLGVIYRLHNKNFE